MTHDFDEDFWEDHWRQAGGPGAEVEIAPNPYLAREIRDLVPGTALDAGCGEGAEAILLARAGWQVTAVDISAEALARAEQRAARDGAPSERLAWVRADLGIWEPSGRFDLVTTHYAHPAMPQLAFYDRLGEWVAPGGTLLIVGHRHAPDETATGHEHGHGAEGHAPPAAATVTAERVTAGLDGTRWQVVTAEEPTRTVSDRGGRAVSLTDVVVRAIRRR